jgi:hypothetical protein
MAVWLVARQARQPDEGPRAPDAERLCARAAAGPGPRRFNLAGTGQIVGSVAPQRSHEQRLAASGLDGTLVRKLPADFDPADAWGSASMPRGSGQSEG